MKKAKKPRPKISIRLSVASKKLAKHGLNKVALTLNWPELTSGDTTSQIYRIRAHTVKKKRKGNKKVKALI
ncbi:MAG TPA: hypothetical protein VGN36_03140, partial [Sphingorhabdus sp.]|nr:hypothetical protein [Sphingorhabdus sp.]